MTVLKLMMKPDMLSPRACRDYLQNIFHPLGAECPECRARVISARYIRWRDGMGVKCTFCNTEFTWRTSTPLAGKGVDERQLVLLIALTTYGRPQAEIADACNLSTRTVRRYQRMLETMAERS